jgi:hypothetical protein
VGHDREVVLGILVGRQPILVAGARLGVPLELARLEEAQGLGAELALHDRRHRKDALLDLALGHELREAAEHHGRLARADASGERDPLVGADQLDRPLPLDAVRPGHGRLEQLDRLARFELRPDDAHHLADHGLGGMADGAALARAGATSDPRRRPPSSSDAKKPIWA